MGKAQGHATTPHGWSAELRIRFRALRYAREPGQPGVCRFAEFISARHGSRAVPIPRGEEGETSRSHHPARPSPELPDPCERRVAPVRGSRRSEHAADGTVSLGGRSAAI